MLPMAPVGDGGDASIRTNSAVMTGKRPGHPVGIAIESACIKVGRDTFSWAW